jgi:hypothetical protein
MSCEEDGVSCDYRACDLDQFNNNGKCEDCNNLMSTAVIAGSFLSFAVAAWYSTIVATDRKKMMQLKVATTFFQTAELTTLISVSWPAMVFFTLPFQVSGGREEEEAAGGPQGAFNIPHQTCHYFDALKP